MGGRDRRIHFRNFVRVRDVAHYPKALETLLAHRNVSYSSESLLRALQPVSELRVGTTPTATPPAPYLTCRDVFEQ